MSRNGRQLMMAEGPAIGDHFWLSDEVVAQWRAEIPIQCIAAGPRLLSVLVVDNDRDTTDSLSTLVTMWGHDVRKAYSGAAALEMISACPPDVLVLDIAMPAIDGFQLARQLRRQSRFKDILLIALTGYGDEAHRLRGLEAGFDHYFMKPVDPSTVEQLLLRTQLRRTESRDALLV
jgi:DNA-binding response OmpR family regulator